MPGWPALSTFFQQMGRHRSPAGRLDFEDLRMTVHGSQSSAGRPTVPARFAQAAGRMIASCAQPTPSCGLRPWLGRLPTRGLASESARMPCGLAAAALAAAAADSARVLPYYCGLGEQDRRCGRSTRAADSSLRPAERSTRAAGSAGRAARTAAAPAAAGMAEARGGASHASAPRSRRTRRNRRLRRLFC